MKAKVSIIVALYNKEKYIKKCIKSLINQSLKEIEIIVVNDCSTDKSLSIVESFNDKRIKIINNKKNMGIGRTRNNGLKHAKGKYIGFVDADDYVEKDMFKRYYEYCEDNEIDLLNTDYYKIIDGVKTYFKVDSFDDSNIINNPNVINKINYGPWNKLYLKSLIESSGARFLEDSKFEDVIFVAACVNSANKIGYLKEAYYNYMIYDQSETKTVDDRTFNIFNVVDNVRNIYSNLKDTPELEFYVIDEITRYMLKARYMHDDSKREDLILMGYNYLFSVNHDWRNNKYYLKTSILKRIIKNNKTFMSFYCKIISRGESK